MSCSIRGRFREQVRFLRRQFLQDDALPFTDVLSESAVAQALKALDVVWLDRIYSPLVTLWVFLGQVLSQDHSCRAAVARLIAHRISRGQRPCSAETGAYCQARKRLPEEFYAEVARKAGQSLDNSAKKEWLWKGRRVLTYDGSTVSMPDTAENQQAYLQPPQQRAGVGFPLARSQCSFHSRVEQCLIWPSAAIRARDTANWECSENCGTSCVPVMFSLPTATCALGTKSICSSSVESTRSRVFITAAESTSDAVRGLAKAITLSIGAALVAQTLKLLPEQLTIRETRVRIHQPGFRCRSMIVVSTLLEAVAVTASDLAELYRARWNAELDLRSLKLTLQMDILCCKTPDLVRKELWAHILAYNRVRAIMAQAATEHCIEPRTISLKGTIQTLEAFQPLFAIQGDRDRVHRRKLYKQFFDAVATHRVADRPNRFEPRLRKRRPKKYDSMLQPRHVIKRKMLKRVR